MRVICYYVKYLFFFSIYIFVSSPEGDLTAIVIKLIMSKSREYEYFNYIIIHSVYKSVFFIKPT